jgi:hypothetical protein
MSDDTVHGPEEQEEKEQEWLGNVAGPNVRGADEQALMFGHGGVIGAAEPSPERLREMGAAEQNRIAEHEAKEEAHYNAMTPAQRDKEYVHPGLMTRIKQFWFGA